MKLFEAGAMRQAIGTARIDAANALVRRTLAQHGLSMPASLVGGPPKYAPPLSEGVRAQFDGTKRSDHTAPTDLPNGARFEHDTFSCIAGSRNFRTYVPASAVNGVTGVVMMLHGCTQMPEDFAAGTGMNSLAETHGFIAVYPAQSRGANAQSCWNWFSRGDQKRDKGEPAILAGIARQVCSAHNVQHDKCCVAGLSAGAAMAVILGEAYPDLFAAVGAHSGLPFGAAKDVSSAFGAMAGNIPAQTNAEVSHFTRTVVFHGTSDSTVHPRNGAAIMDRAMTQGSPQSVESVAEGHAQGRHYTCRISSSIEGRLNAEHWMIDGQGHAWSGGHPTGSYTDPKGPDASAEMIRFFFDTSR